MSDRRSYTSTRPSNARPNDSAAAAMLSGAPIGDALSAHLLSSIFNRVPAAVCQRVMEQEPSSWTSLGDSCDGSAEDAVHYEALGQMLTAVRRRDMRGAIEIMRVFVEPTAVETQRRWYTGIDAEKVLSTDSTDVTPPTSGSTSQDGRPKVRVRGSAGKKNKALVKNEPGKRRVVKYTRSPVPDVSTSDNDDSWMGGPQFRQAPLDGRHLLLTQIDSEEWESLGSVDMHTVPNAKAGPFSPRTADVAAAASAAADVRNRVQSAPRMSSESSLSRQSTPEKCAAPLSFWVPMTGGTGRLGEPPAGPGRPAHRSVPNRLLGYQRGAKSATRAKGGPKHHAQDYAGGGHTHPPARNGTSTKVHKTRKQRASAAEPSRVRVAKYGRDGIWTAETSKQPSSHTMQMQQTPRAAVRPQRIPSTWERSLRNNDHGATIAAGCDNGVHAGGAAAAAAAAKPNARSAPPPLKDCGTDDVSTAMGSLNLILLPEQAADDDAALAQWTELNTTWYRT